MIVMHASEGQKQNMVIVVTWLAITAIYDSNLALWEQEHSETKSTLRPRVWYTTKKYNDRHISDFNNIITIIIVSIDCSPMLLKHKHTQTCRKQGRYRCRFDFPKKASAWW